MPTTTKVLRVDAESYELIESYRLELERRRQEHVSLPQAVRLLLVATAKRIMAEDTSTDRRQ